MAPIPSRSPIGALLPDSGFLLGARSRPHRVSGTPLDFDAAQKVQSRGVIRSRYRVPGDTVLRSRKEMLSNTIERKQGGEDRFPMCLQ